MVETPLENSDFPWADPQKNQKHRDPHQWCKPGADTCSTQTPEKCHFSKTYLSCNLGTLPKFPRNPARTTSQLCRRFASFPGKGSFYLFSSPMQSPHLSQANSALRQMCSDQSMQGPLPGALNVCHTRPLWQGKTPTLPVSFAPMGPCRGKIPSKHLALCWWLLYRGQGDFSYTMTSVKDSSP